MGLEALLRTFAPDGKDFERLCKWLLENVAEYRSQLKQVWLWDEWPGRQGRDIGIDLVAEDREGGLWAVQAKHYDPAYSIKKADLDSFLSASSRAEFTYRLLIATTDHLGVNARNTIGLQEKPVGVLLRSQLEALKVAWPTSITRLRPAKPERKRARPHQRRAIQDCARGLAVADRGQLVMACGTGKTLIGPFLAEKMAAKRVLVLVPSLSLLGQTLREWATAVEFDYLAVCSDKTVTKDEQDAIVASTSELGIPVTTEPERIARFLRRRGSATKVVFSTYQSSPQIAAAHRTRVPGFDLVIADEAHRCAGPEAGAFATVLDATKIKARKRLFMTATPRYFTGRMKREAKEADWEVASMDEDEKFGRVLHRLTFADAIDQDLLSDYQVVVVGVSDREAHDLAERAAFVTRDGKAVMDARTLARQIGLLRAMAKQDLHRVVSFHSRVNHARSFASSLLETNEWLPAHRRPNGTLWTDHVSGKMTAGERDVRLRHLNAVGSGERGVLTNARCLTEGVDVPTLDGVAFIDPRRSQVDVVQAVGRAIRDAPGKMVGTVIIPVFVEEGTDPEDALDSGEFDRVWQVVRALRDHDDVLAEEIDELRRELGQRGAIRKDLRKITFDLPVGVGDAFARAFETRLVEIASPKWEFWFGLLVRFIEREGHAVVRQDYIEDGLRLGTWLAAQRVHHNAGTLDVDRARRLEALPGWTWDPHADAWERGFAVMRRYIERVGHAKVPQRHVEDGFNLGVWANNQGIWQTAGWLDQDRARRLEALPGWAWRRSHEDRWEQRFALLERFVKRQGHAIVPSKHLEEGFNLGRWAATQLRHQNAGALRADRARRLGALPGWPRPTASDVRRGVASTEERTQSWERGFAHLMNFIEREGHAAVPRKHTVDGFKLGGWVDRMRTYQRRGALDSEQAARLEALPGWTWSRARPRLRIEHGRPDPVV